jgi:hypothetical protein
VCVSVSESGKVVGVYMCVSVKMCVSVCVLKSQRLNQPIKYS